MPVVEVRTKNLPGIFLFWVIFFGTTDSGLFPNRYLLSSFDIPGKQRIES